MPDHLDALAFQLQLIALQGFGHNGAGRRAVLENRPPVSQLGRAGLLDIGDGGRRGQYLGFGVGAGQNLEAEVEVRVAMADEDGGQALTAGADTFDQFCASSLVNCASPINSTRI